MNRLKLRRPNNLLLLALVALSLGLGVFIPKNTMAIESLFFDTVGSNCDVLTARTYALECGSLVVAKAAENENAPTMNTDLRAYFTSTTNKRIVIQGDSFCPNNQVSVNRRDRDNAGYWTPGWGTAVTRFIVGNGTYNSAARRATSTYCDPGHADFSREINLTAADFRPVPGASNYYYVDIAARHINVHNGGSDGNTVCNGAGDNDCDGVSNGFRIQSQRRNADGTWSGDGIVAIAGDTTCKNNGDCVALQVGVGDADHDTQANYRSYALRFASPCEQTASSQNVAVRFYDLDYPASSPIRLVMRDVTTDMWLGGGGWTSNRPSYAQAHQVPQSNNGYSQWTFTATRDHKYILYMLNVSPGLVTQVGLPYDSAYYSLVCDPPATIHPVVENMPAAAQIGETITPRFRIINDSNASAADTTVDYTMRFWRSPDNSGTFGPGDVRILNPDQTGNNVPVPYTDVDLGTKTTTASNSGYICASLQLSGASPSDTIINSNPAWRCTPVAKSPSFQVNTGDVRTGGSYFGAGSSCQVARPAAIDTNAEFAQYYGVTAHNYSVATPATPYHANVTRGIFSTGSLYNITSNNPGLGDARGSSLNFARGAGATPPAGSGQATALGGQFHGGETEMLAAGTSFNSHCLTSVFSPGRYTASTNTVPDSAADTQALPAPVAGVRATTYEVCGNLPGKTLTLNAPSGSALTLAPGQRYVVRVVQGTGGTCNANPVTLLLNTNVIFSGATTAENLPQFVLLAGDSVTSRVQVKVAAGVTRLDGIYANFSQNQDIESFLTCADKVAKGNINQISQAQCNSRLVINGAVILGGRLTPYRTAGHDTITNTDPAERFNLRPDILLGDTFRGGPASLNTVSQRELAPRY